MDFFFFRNVKPEDEKNFAAALEKAFGDSEENLIVKIDEIRKQKKADYDKQRYLDRKNSTMENVKKVGNPKEERENEKENEEKERSKEKEVKERVKEKEELINIYAEPKKVEKHRYGNFRHVLLSDDEYQRLHADFPDLQDRIQRLDDYLENTGKVYKNHALTIRNWANKDAQQGLPKQIPKEETFHDLKVKMEQREQDNIIDSFWRI
jgi:hypothetical protein